MGRPRNDRINVYPVRRGRFSYVLRWVDPSTGKKRQAKCDASNHKDAVRAALELQAELDSAPRDRLSWLEFRAIVRTQYLAGLSPATQRLVGQVLSEWEKHVGIVRGVASIGSAEVGRFSSALTGAAATRAKKLRALKAILNWARKGGYIKEVPHIEMPKRGRGFLGKSRPIDEVTFQKLKDAVAAHVGPDFAESWLVALDGLWTSGMRLGEMLALTFDRISRSPSGAVVIRWSHGDQKSRRAETTPTAPEFAALLDSLPYREGRVFRPALSRGIVHPNTFSHTIEAACEAAGLKVTSHDLRRSFADRWSRKVTPMVLSRLMRCSMAVIKSYYAELDSESIGEELLRASAVTRKSPNTPSET